MLSGISIHAMAPLAETAALQQIVGYLVELTIQFQFPELANRRQLLARHMGVGPTLRGRRRCRR